MGESHSMQVFGETELLRELDANLRAAAVIYLLASLESHAALNIHTFNPNPGAGRETCRRVGNTEAMGGRGRGGAIGSS